MTCHGAFTTLNTLIIAKTSCGGRLSLSLENSAAYTHTLVRKFDFGWVSSYVRSAIGAYSYGTALRYLLGSTWLPDRMWANGSSTFRASLCQREEWSRLHLYPGRWSLPKILVDMAQSLVPPRGVHLSSYLKRNQATLLTKARKPIDTHSSLVYLFRIELWYTHVKFSKSSESVSFSFCKLYLIGFSTILRL